MESQAGLIVNSNRINIANPINGCVRIFRENGIYYGKLPNGVIEQITGLQFVTIGSGLTGNGTPGSPLMATNIYNSDGTLTSNRTLNMDGKFLIFTDGANTSVNFLERKLFDQSNNLILDWNGGQFLRPDGSLSIDFFQSWLMDNTMPSQIVSIAWVDRILYTVESGNQIPSVSWASRSLQDNTAFDTLDWQGRRLISSINGDSVNWEERKLFDSTSGDSSLDWEAKELHSVWDARDGLKVGTGDTVTKIITATDALDFPDTLSQSSSDLTIALSGAAIGDSVILGTDPSSVLPDSCYTAWVSNADEVTVRFNNYSTVNQDPPQGTFRVSIIKF